MSNTPSFLVLLCEHSDLRVFCTCSWHACPHACEHSDLRVFCTSSWPSRPLPPQHLFLPLGFLFPLFQFPPIYVHECLHHKLGSTQENKCAFTLNLFEFASPCYISRSIRFPADFIISPVYSRIEFCYLYVIYVWNEPVSLPTYLFMSLLCPLVTVGGAAVSTGVQTWHDSLSTFFMN